jgi:hypothetical protein
VAERARLAPGVRLRAEIDGLGTLAAVVTAIAPEPDQASQRVYIDADLRDAAATVRVSVSPGLAAAVRCDDPRCAAATGSAHAP